MMLVSDFDYLLPKELIAQVPEKKRTASKMLVLARNNGRCEVKPFIDFPSYVRPGDCVVVNNTKVLPARLYGNKIPGGAKVEALLVEEKEAGIWNALLRPARRMKVGTEVHLSGSNSDIFRVNNQIDERLFEIKFSSLDVLGTINRYGHMPLPPYIRREAAAQDVTRYQTIFATQIGAIAAPTAGLHFDEPIIQRIKSKGVTIVPITLHINLGTFNPVAVERVAEHSMHAENYEISANSANIINTTRSSGGSIWAVGTSVVRTLESSLDDKGRIRPGRDTTNLFLHPPMKPRVVDKLLTNFHLPKSTLLMLVCTFGSRESILAAYNLAVHKQFRFYSYGDCMLLL